MFFPLSPWKTTLSLRWGGHYHTNERRAPEFHKNKMECWERESLELQRQRYTLWPEKRKMPLSMINHGADWESCDPFKPLVCSIFFPSLIVPLSCTLWLCTFFLQLFFSKHISTGKGGQPNPLHLVKVVSELGIWFELKLQLGYMFYEFTSCDGEDCNIGLVTGISSPDASFPFAILITWPHCHGCTQLIIESEEDPKNCQRLQSPKS